MNNDDKSISSSISDSAPGPIFGDSDLADVFDRYAAALDVGDQAGAERILSAQPEIEDGYRAPLRGLYLLERAAAQQKRSAQFEAGQGGPQRLGDFEFEEELGRGGMGIVYAARQISLQRRVALKILPFTSVLDPRYVARFQNEAQAAASLHHPNIVPVYGTGCERGVHYYSMQLIEGQTLAQFLEPVKADADKLHIASPNADTVEALDTFVCVNSEHYCSRIVELGACVAEALHFAHEQGIVHRDIKPSNLLLDRTGKVWVADFGLARGRGSADLTAQGEQLGTLLYMSPEQAMGRKNFVDFRTDIYSLGLTLYELLTGCKAFNFEDRTQMLAAIESVEPKSIRQINSSVSVDLETVINKAISKLPADRYNSAQEFADDLKRCQLGQPVVAKRKTVVDRCVRSVVKHKWMFTSVFAALVATTIAAILIASVFYQQRTQAIASAQQARFYLKQAHQAVDRFGAILDDQLADLPGSQPLRSDLLDEAAGYYDDFLKYAESEPSLKFEKAVCLTRLGLIRKRQGDFNAAVSAYDEAIAGFATLPPEDRNRVEVTIAESQAQANLAMVAGAEGDSQLATTHFENAISALTNRAQRTDGLTSRDELQLQIALSKVNGNYISVLQRSDPALVEGVLRRAIASLELANGRLPVVHVTGDTQPTSEKKLLQENLAHLADMKNNLAVELCHQGKLDEAKFLMLSVIRQLTAQESATSSKPATVERLAVAHNTLGEILWRGDEIDASAASFENAEALLRKLLLSQPSWTSQPKTLSCLASVLHNRVLVCMKQQRADVASVAIQEAIELQENALAANPQNAQFRRLLSAHQQALALSAKRRRLPSQSEMSQSEMSQSEDITLLHDGDRSSNPSPAMAR